MKSKISFLVLLNLLVTLNAQNYWQQSSGPYGGIVYSLSTNSIGYIYAGTLGHGIYRSTDGGNIWSSVGLQDKSIYSLVTNVSDQVFACDNESGYVSVSYTHLTLPTSDLV